MTVLISNLITWVHDGMPFPRVVLDSRTNCERIIISTLNDDHYRVEYVPNRLNPRDKLPNTITEYISLAAMLDNVSFMFGDLDVDISGE